MILLINGSNLKIGGGLQVADSFCRTLSSFPEHVFHVVLSSKLRRTLDDISSYPNVVCHEHSVSNRSIPEIISGRDRFLDNIVRNNGIEAVISIFGPICWKPDRPHLVGFARAQILVSSSPYYELLSPAARMVEHVRNHFIKRFFMRSGDMFYTENGDVTEKVKRLFHTDKVITATNTFNQVFCQPEMMNEYGLPPFDGTTLLTVSSNHVHKNLRIIPQVSSILAGKYPDFKFRFVVTVPKDCFQAWDGTAMEHVLCIGPVDISQCPSLYRQCDLEFQPTLLECFTATYPEAMVSERPIITTDLDFSHGLCGKAAAYYDPLDAEDAADTIYRVACDEAVRKAMVEEGRNQLKHFDNYLTRARKIIDYISKNDEQ